MPFQHHAITSGARQAGFWPSIADASTQLQAQRWQQTGRRRRGDPAVAPPSQPGTLAHRRPRGAR